MNPFEQKEMQLFFMVANWIKKKKVGLEKIDSMLNFIFVIKV